MYINCEMTQIVQDIYVKCSNLNVGNCVTMLFFMYSWLNNLKEHYVHRVIRSRMYFERS
jgi:hypothetical protein